MSPDHGDLMWCDLSTFNQSQARSFYVSVLKWTVADDRNGYEIASAAGAAVAGLYPMPDRFRQIGMPSFWMTYIRVDDTGETAQKAERIGGKVESPPQAFDATGSYALIRDPLGAGFTIYDGALADGVGRGAGGRLRHELYVSSPEAVMTFYAALFDWRLDVETPQRWRIVGASAPAALNAAPEEIRGPFEFWDVHFGVDDLDAAQARVQSAGGRVKSRFGEALMVEDPDGATFFLEGV